MECLILSESGESPSRTSGKEPHPDLLADFSVSNEKAVTRRTAAV